MPRKPKSAQEEALKKAEKVAANELTEEAVAKLQALIEGIRDGRYEVKAYQTNSNSQAKSIEFRLQLRDLS